ncbi:MAG TPA: hypothetical protein VJC11_00185 [Patescibacteria group bacterium]|nr:hypothetical protein [Patescibacteria group bacterium]
MSKSLSQFDKLILSILIIILTGMVGWIMYPALFATTQKTTSHEMMSQMFSDEGGHYTIFVPDNWKLKGSSGPTGVQISFLEFESPDFMAHSESCGPFDCIYYDRGMRFSIAVENTDLLNKEPQPIEPTPNKLIIAKERIVIDGIETTYNKFKEPSTSQGVLLDAQFDHKGSTYYVQAGYNPETYTKGAEVFKNISKSLKLSAK